jgi:hypothetical protein
MRLTPEQEDALFQALASQLLARVTGDTCEHCGRSAATAQDLTVLRLFLSDNSITCDVPNSTPLRSLTDKVHPFPVVAEKHG